MGIELNDDDRLVTRSLHDFARLVEGYRDLISGADREGLDEEWAVFVREARRLAKPTVSGRFAWPRREWEDWKERMLSLYLSVPDQMDKLMILAVAGWDGLRIELANFGVDQEYPEIVQVVIETGGRLPDATIAKALAWKNPETNPEEDLQDLTFWVPKYVYKAPKYNFDDVAQFVAIVLQERPDQVSLSEFGPPGGTTFM